MALIKSIIILFITHLYNIISYLYSTLSPIVYHLFLTTIHIHYKSNIGLSLKTVFLRMKFKNCNFTIIYLSRRVYLVTDGELDLQSLITHSCRLIEYNMVEDHFLQNPATDIKTANKVIKIRHQTSTTTIYGPSKGNKRRTLPNKFESFPFH